MERLYKIELDVYFLFVRLPAVRRTDVGYGFAIHRRFFLSKAKDQGT